ncbi:FAR1-related sequence 5-like protein [Tanacetum coccineum]|uniref:FAR1-related sequence 5-like protein n=1 Tax=Tanacetum coccineum TaxID=301880 RepID=A0ABQ5G901_9ASTR
MYVDDVERLSVAGVGRRLMIEVGWYLLAGMGGVGWWRENNMVALAISCYYVPLHSNGYVHDFSTNDVTNELEALFFVHSTSFKIWRAFPHVLMIDDTEKMNKYNMPFVEIVGVTSIRKTFCIAFAFISEEKMDNYKWVLECLKLTLDERILPRVINTDREPTIKAQHDLDSFLLAWKLLKDSPTQISYMEIYKQLQLVLRNYPRLQDVIGDGNCEFRLVVVALGLSEDQ